MHIFVYETKNLLNNKIYIGVHATLDINDGYLGSGKLLQRAIEKYGEENFVRKIIKTFKSKEEAFQYEKEIVTEAFVKLKTTYNLKVGGHGGWDHIANDLTLLSEMGNRRRGKNNGMFGKTHSEESRNKISLHKTGYKLGKQSTEHINKKAISKCISYELISPLNETFTTKNLKMFCEEHGLVYKTMSKIPLTGRQPTSGDCVGWRIRKIID